MGIWRREVGCQVGWLLGRRSMLRREVGCPGKEEGGSQRKGELVGVKYTDCQQLGGGDGGFSTMRNDRRERHQIMEAAAPSERLLEASACCVNSLYSSMCCLSQHGLLHTA